MQLKASKGIGKTTACTYQSTRIEQQPLSSSTWREGGGVGVAGGSSSTWQEGGKGGEILSSGTRRQWAMEWCEGGLGSLHGLVVGLKTRGGGSCGGFCVLGSHRLVVWMPDLRISRKGGLGGAGGQR